MKNRKNIPIPLIILAFMTFWPLGVVLLLMNLTNMGKLPKMTGYSKNSYEYSDGAYRFDREGQDTPYKSSDDSHLGFDLGQETNSLFNLKKGKRIRDIGVAITLLGTALGAASFAALISDYYFFSEALGMSGALFALFGVPGIALTLKGSSMLEKARTFRRYSQIIGKSPEISLDRLAGAMNTTYEKVCKDINMMIDRGGFDGYYIDNARRVLTSEHLTAAAPQEPKKEEHQMSPADQIRFINGKVLQPEVSAKMLKLETLTRRVYAYTDAHPEKEKFAANFKQRYLPMTIKILEAYSNFESSGSAGENVTSAMKETEAVLDTLISSFEKQLDMLYMDEAIDITTDIDVLERMIQGDGFGESPFAGLRQEQK